MRVEFVCGESRRFWISRGADAIREKKSARTLWLERKRNNWSRKQQEINERAKTKTVETMRKSELGSVGSDDSRTIDPLRESFPVIGCIAYL